MLKILFIKGASCCTQILEKLSTSADVDLDLSENPLGKFTQCDLIEMIDALANHHIESIDLTATLLHLKTTNELIEILTTLNRVGIKRVNLSNNRLGKHDSDIDLVNLMRLFQDSAFEELNLSSNELGGLARETFLELLETLAESPLARIIFDFNQLSKIGGPYHLADLFHYSLKSRLVLDSTDRFTVTIKERLALLNASSDDIPVRSADDFFSGSMMR